MVSLDPRGFLLSERGETHQRDEAPLRLRAPVVDDVLAGPGECDFVASVSQRLPMWTISELVGVPLDERVQIVAAADSMVGWNDPEVQGGRQPLDVILESLVALHTAARGLTEAR